MKRMVTLLVAMVLFCPTNPLARSSDILECFEEQAAGYAIKKMVETLVVDRSVDQQELWNELRDLGEEVAKWGLECVVPPTKLARVLDVPKHIRTINTIMDKYGGELPPLDPDHLRDWAELGSAAVGLGFALNKVGTGAAAFTEMLVATPALGVVMVPFMSASLVGLTELWLIGGIMSQINAQMFINYFVTKIYRDYTSAQKAAVQHWAQQRGDVWVPEDLVQNPYFYVQPWYQFYNTGPRVYWLVPDYELNRTADDLYVLKLYLYFYTMDDPGWFGTPNGLKVSIELEFEDGTIVPITEGAVEPYDGGGFRARELYGFTETADPVPIVTLYLPIYSALPKSIVYEFSNPYLPQQDTKTIRLHPFHHMVSNTRQIVLTACAGETVNFSFELSTHPGWVWKEIETPETAGRANDPGIVTFWVSDLFKELGNTEGRDVEAELDTRIPGTSVYLRSQYVDEDGTKISGTVKVPADAEPGEYYFWILAKSERGGVTPVQVSLNVHHCDVLAPSSLVATATGTTIRLVWQDNSDNENGFEIWRKIGGGAYGDSYYAKVPANTTSFEDQSVQPGIRYTYKVRAYVSGPPQFYSDFTNEATADPGVTVPAPPSGLEVRERNDSLVIRWQDNSDSEAGFEIWRRVGEAGYGSTYYKRVGPDVVEYTDTEVTPGTQYTYKVRAYNAAGFSEFTAEVSKTYWGSWIARPTDLRAYALSAHHIRLSWKDNANNEQGYRVERKEADDRYFKYFTDLPANSTSFDDVYGLDPNTTYVYRVCAYNESSKSCSEEVLCTTNAEISGMADSVWPTGHGSEFRTGYSPVGGTLVPTEKWRRYRLGIGSSYYASPVVGPDGTIYIARDQTCLLYTSPSPRDRG